MSTKLGPCRAVFCPPSSSRLTPAQVAVGGFHRSVDLYSMPDPRGPG